MRFSRRSNVGEIGPPSENALTRAIAEVAGRQAFLDLTVSNPTAARIPYDATALVRAFAQPHMLAYEPHPLGLASARAIVAEEIGVASSQIALTASTSEAYAVLFKLFCDPGDEILVPTPSYPLLDWLASFESVTLKQYPLVYAGGWHIDIDALKQAVTNHTRAIVVVAPNNPTGSYLGAEELEALLDLGLPIISDEVFAHYPLGPMREGRLSSVLTKAAARGLVFSLSGLSKMAALPQMKLGWIACAGDPERVNATMNRLELVLDAYLSVGAPVQHALKPLLEASRATTDEIRLRTAENLAAAWKIARKHDLITQLDVEGGWYVTWRVPETMSDEEWALTLVREDSVYVHPGYYFDMRRGAHLVLSLLTPEDEFSEGIARIAARVK